MKFRFFLILAAFSLLLAVPGCSKNFGAKGSKTLTPVVLQEAQAHDIPVPLGSKAQTHHFINDKNGGFFMGYLSHLSSHDLIKFYSLEMERYGWQRIGLSQGNDENLMVFDKPHRYSVISLRASGRSSLIIITTGNKEEGYSYK